MTTAQRQQRVHNAAYQMTKIAVKMELPLLTAVRIRPGRLTGVVPAGLDASILEVGLACVPPVNSVGKFPRSS
jgi:hypothetical protein